MQVCLPGELIEAVRARRLPVSEILQTAVRAELRRLDFLAETDRYIEQLTSHVGAPRPADRSRARALAARVANRRRRRRR
jgi:hypothetical protein